MLLSLIIEKIKIQISSCLFICLKEGPNFYGQYGTSLIPHYTFDKDKDERVIQSIHKMMVDVFGIKKEIKF